MLPRRENRVALFGDNELTMAKDVAATAEEMLKAVGAEDVVVRREPLTEGWSIHELGTARMGRDATTSVTNSFGQTYDVKNLLIVDGSVFVPASVLPEPDVDDSCALVARRWIISRRRCGPRTYNGPSFRADTSLR